MCRASPIHTSRISTSIYPKSGRHWVVVWAVRLVLGRRSTIVAPRKRCRTISARNVSSHSSSLTCINLGYSVSIITTAGWINLLLLSFSEFAKIPVGAQHHTCTVECSICRLYSAASLNLFYSISQLAGCNSACLSGVRRDMQAVFSCYKTTFLHPALHLAGKRLLRLRWLSDFEFTPSS